MQLSNRFSVAVHALLCVALFARDYKVTSEFIAGSVGVNPVVIRRILGQLKKAGLVDVAAGTGGATLTSGPDRITLLDVYRAVDLLEDDTLFSFHANPNPLCPVGRGIHAALDGHIRDAQRALEDSLAAVPLSSLVKDIPIA
ncbi:Rrf2 family transcriptional regulator [uncultured Bilophila sp.]|uniref:Rrf2 family transcriptional regulator n=1 Tax=uncultured Bilophila sp. TaxID=529385 RepID=UPI00280AFCD2|nr:Rrf2 family transcriptional regulator [uncultured Bilophila sp.]